MTNSINNDSSHNRSEPPDIENEFFKRTIEVSPEAIFWLASEGNFSYVNNKACESLGYSRSELLSMFLWEVDPDFPKERWEKQWEDLKTIQANKFETRHRRKDGTIFPVEVYANQMNFRGEIFHTAFVRDLSERKQTQAALHESEGRFRALLDTIPDFIWLKDADGVFLTCNATFEQLLGAKASEIIGKTDYDFVDRELADFFRHHDKLAMQAGKPTSNEEWITLAQSGERILLLTTKVPMYDSDGGIIGVLGVGRDITQLRNAEQERLELENQLQQAQKIESIGQLAGGVAHDFNNMLGVILGHTDLAFLKIEQEKPIEANLKEIQKAAKHSADLTRQLLTFARKQTISPKVIDLNETIPGMLKMLQRFIGENIQLSWTPAPNLWSINVDPSQVDQILANLCVNARDAINGNGHIYIATQNIIIDDNPGDMKAFDALPGEYVKISVSDDGCGIEKEVLDHIFEPFFTTKEIGAGTGLGLATVYGAVKQNNGFIDVRSEPGLGASFNIFFPRAIKAETVKTGQIKAPAFRGTETILLVEDEEMLLKLETAMLEQCGYTVLAANSAESALLEARTHSGPIQLLITDVIMPKTNGWELSQELCSIRPEMKVIYLSGYPADIISNKGVIQEGINFLQKPISIASLSAKIREVLDVIL